jgi:alkylation response protein AidB-like acyl-CoA dehydrogenase
MPYAPRLSAWSSGLQPDMRERLTACRDRADAPLANGPSTCEIATRSTTTQIYEGTNQIQRVVMARQILKG